MRHTVDEITMPESLDGPGAEQFLEYAAVRNEVENRTLGTGLLAMALPEMLAEYRDNPHRVRRHFVVRLDGLIAGRGMITLRPHSPGTGTYLMVDVLPPHRRSGIGSALLRVLEATAIDSGAYVLKVAVAHTAAVGGERIAAPTGSGDIAAQDDGARFLRSKGYSLEQIVRISLLETAGLADRLRPLGVAAAHVAGPDYRVTTWAGPTPDAWLDDLAVLRTRMSTDAPSAGMVIVPDPWDVERIREHDGRIASSGRTMLTAAIEHAPTGALVGFTELVCAGAGTVAVQEDTLVLREHRGRRLGTLAKLAAADLLGRHAPTVDAVVTWNAEENRPMLDVNEAMGFRAVGLEGAWQKRVED